MQGSNVNTGGYEDLMQKEINWKQGNYLMLYDALVPNISKGPYAYRKLLNSAKEEIRIWDPYIYAHDLKLFNTLNYNVKVQILTSGSFIGNEYNDKLKNLLQGIKDLHNQHGIRIKVRFLNARELQFSFGRDFHDRFLIIDNEYYMVGASMELHSLEDDITEDTIKKLHTTAIMKITNEIDIKIIEDCYKKYWDSGYTKNLI